MHGVKYSTESKLCRESTSAATMSDGIRKSTFQTELAGGLSCLILVLACRTLDFFMTSPRTMMSN